MPPENETVGVLLQCITMNSRLLTCDLCRVFLFPFAFVPDDVAGWMLSIQVAESKIAASCTAHDADPILHASQSHCAVDSLGKRFGLHGRPIKVFQRAVRVAEASVGTRRVAAPTASAVVRQQDFTTTTGWTPSLSQSDPPLSTVVTAR